MKKKYLPILCIMLILLGVFGVYKYTSVIRGEYGLKMKACSEIEREGIEPEDITIVGYAEDGERRLYWFIVENKYQIKTYHPMEFTVVGDNTYKFVHTYTSMDRGEDIGVADWKGMYSFLINNPDCAYIRIKDSLGEEDIPVDTIPFMYSYDRPLPWFEYLFLDINKEVLR